MSSNESKTGSPFQFVLIDPILVHGSVIAAAGAIGDGKLLLAGPAGNKGHEGDLTLRIDSVPTVDGGKVVFDDQHFEINGTNAKLASAAAGFIPFVGFFAQFIRGQDEHLGIRNEIVTVLDRPATIAAAPPLQPCAAPAATATPALSPSPSARLVPTPSPPADPPAPSPSPALPSPAPTQTPCIAPTPAPQITPYGYTYPSASATPSARPSPRA